MPHGPRGQGPGQPSLSLRLDGREASGPGKQLPGSDVVLLSPHLVRRPKYFTETWSTYK